MDKKLREGKERGNNKETTKTPRPKISPAPTKPKTEKIESKKQKAQKISDLSFQELKALLELADIMSTRNRYEGGDKDIINLFALITVDINNDVIRRTKELLKND